MRAALAEREGPLRYPIEVIFVVCCASTARGAARKPPANTPKNVRLSITRSPDPPAAGAIDTGGLTGGCLWHPLIRPRTSTTKRRARRAGTCEDFMHLPSQGLGGERLRKDRVSRLERRPTKLFELGANNGEARHVEHLRVGAPARRR